MTELAKCLACGGRGFWHREGCPHRIEPENYQSFESRLADRIAALTDEDCYKIQGVVGFNGHMTPDHPGFPAACVALRDVLRARLLGTEEPK